MMMYRLLVNAAAIGLAVAAAGDVKGRSLQEDCPAMAEGVMCILIYAPVQCGQNDCEYSNSCFAGAAGFSDVDCRPATAQTVPPTEESTKGSTANDEGTESPSDGASTDMVGTFDPTTYMPSSIEKRLLQEDCPLPSGGLCAAIYDPVLCGDNLCEYSSPCLASLAGFPSEDCAKPGQATVAPTPDETMMASTDGTGGPSATMGPTAGASESTTMDGAEEILEDTTSTMVPSGEVSTHGSEEESVAPYQVTGGELGETGAPSDQVTDAEVVETMAPSDQVTEGEVEEVVAERPVAEGTETMTPSQTMTEGVITETVAPSDEMTVGGVEDTVAPTSADTEAATGDMNVVEDGKTMAPSEGDTMAMTLGDTMTTTTATTQDGETPAPTVGDTMPETEIADVETQTPSEEATPTTTATTTMTAETQSPTGAETMIASELETDAVGTLSPSADVTESVVVEGPPLTSKLCSATFPCNMCEGDCDTDEDCTGDLECFRRPGNDDRLIPGCSGTGLPGADYCYMPSDNDLLVRDEQCSPENPCEACSGDCDSDFDCEGDLICYQTDGTEPTEVPGCVGTVDMGLDFCYSFKACNDDSDCEGEISACSEGSCIVLPTCGTIVCSADEYCCNRSCEICAPLGGGCIQEFCDTSILGKKKQKGRKGEDDPFSRFLRGGN